MTQERKFIEASKRLMQMEEFLQKEFSRAGYSHIDIQRTPLSMRITVYAHKPGMIIGRGGKNIDAMTEALKSQFGIENPQLEVVEVPNPDLDANIVAKQIAAAIERGLNYKRVVNLTIQRSMESGAVGIAIRTSGKVGGEMSRTEKFSAGYLKYAGDPADTLVHKAYARANVKLGVIGIQVRILNTPPQELELLKKIRGMKSEENKVEEKTA